MDRHEKNKSELDRRELLSHITKTGAGVLAAALVSGGVVAVSRLASASTGKRKFRYGMVIDTRRCVGCEACVVACKAENKTPPGVFNNIVLKEPDKKSTVEKPLFMSRPCFHCENPPCVPACPKDATYKRESDGIVVVDYDRCVGYQDCIDACPYGARTFDEGKDYPAISEKTPYAQVPSPEYNQFRLREGDTKTEEKARKCTFCLHLQDQEGRYDKKAGRWPACAKTCTGHAIHFGDFNDPDSDVSRLLKERKSIRLKENLGTQPNVYYLV